MSGTRRAPRSTTSPPAETSSTVFTSARAARRLRGWRVDGGTDTRSILGRREPLARRSSGWPPGSLQGRAVPSSVVPERRSTAASALSQAQRHAVVELMRVTPVADELARRFAARGHALALVGGSVRNAFLGRSTDDLDFTTDARPEEMLAAAADWADASWQTGIEYGTVGFAKDGLTLEVTTYRAETYDTDSRKPAVVYGDSLEADLGRRDFTINAMAVTLPDHRLVDPFGGLEDLAARRLRTPTDAESLFTDDPLRMMRAARFAAQLGFDVDPTVVAAMTAMAHRLEIVSAERVREELIKLVLSPSPRVGLELLVDTGLADVVFPELPRLKATVDEHRRHKDVYEHTLTVLDQAIALERTRGFEPDLVIRLAAIMHDIGKPKTRSFGPGGGVSFHHHETVGAAMTRARMSALRFAKPVIEDVARLVELHLRFHGYVDGEWSDSAVRRYVRDAGPLLDRLHVLTRSDCTTRNRRKAEMLARAYDALEERIARLAEQEELDAIRPPLNGNEVQEVLGLAPGPEIGMALKFLLERRLEQGPIEHADAVAMLREWAVEQGLAHSAGQT
jgi:poly(A) polymerase